MTFSCPFCLSHFATTSHLVFWWETEFSRKLTISSRKYENSRNSYLVMIYINMPPFYMKEKITSLIFKQNWKDHLNGNVFILEAPWRGFWTHWRLPFLQSKPINVIASNLMITPMNGKLLDWFLRSDFYG